MNLVNIFCQVNKHVQDYFTGEFPNPNISAQRSPNTLLIAQQLTLTKKLMQVKIPIQQYKSKLSKPLNIFPFYYLFQHILRN